MKRLVIVFIVSTSLGCLISSCGGGNRGKNDAPAGNPDELKDSTRLDAAPDTGQAKTEPQNRK